MTLPSVGPGPVADFITTLNSNFVTIAAGGALDSGSLAPNAVIEATISNGAVTASKISAGAVTATAISDDAVIERTISDGAVTTDKLTFPTVNSSIQDGDVSTWRQFIGNLVYPVGSYYWSSKNISPASIFGGTWDQITNTFLYAISGSGDASSATTAIGGEMTHILTTSEMPSHTHKILSAAAQTFTSTPNVGSGIFVAKDYRQTEASGGGQPHNNMPPYLTAYCWRRKTLA